MAELDVSDIVLDPLIAGDAFIVIRRRDDVNNFGEGVTADARLPAVGAIYPSGDNSLLREEAFQTQANTITVVTQFALRGSGGDEAGKIFQPDIVLWEGNHYQVRVVNSYGQYGAGFVEAECIATDYVLAGTTPE